MIDDRPTIVGTQATRAVQDLTIAIEFMVTTLRAIVSGHAVGAEMVQTPLLFAKLKLNEVGCVPDQAGVSANSLGGAKCSTRQTTVRPLLAA